MTDKEKLELIREIEHLSWRQLAQRIGTRTAQTFTDIRAGKHGISRGLAFKLLQTYPQLREEWLATGIGSPFKNDDRTGVPVYDGNVPDTGSFETPNAKGRLDIQTVYPSADVVMRNNGDAMADLPQGCYMVLKKTADTSLLVPGRNYVIVTDEFCLPRRVQRGATTQTLTLYATNAQTYSDGRRIYEPIEVPMSAVKAVYSILGYVMAQADEPKINRI